jgi:hypothetical protein
MKRTNRFFLALIVAILGISQTAMAQVMKQVPANALAVLKISKLSATSKKLGDFAGSLGITQAQPDFADPLASVEKNTGITQGINADGEFAFVFIDPDAAGGDSSKSMLMLIPVSDYKTFLANWPDATADGGISDIHLKGDTDTSYVANWGDYAAISPVKDIVAKKGDSIVVTDMAQKELDTKDFVLLANMKVIRAKVLPQIDDARKQMMDAIDQGVQNAPKVGTLDLTKLVPIIKVAANQLMNLGKDILTDADSATYSAIISPDGIATTTVAEFQPDSYLGKTIGSFKNTDASLLAGLPDAKYLFFGGSVSDPTIAGSIYDDMVGPIEAAAKDQGDDAKPIVDVLDTLKTMVTAQTAGSFGMLAPSGQLGQDALLQFIQVRDGDSKVLDDGQHKLFDIQQQFMKQTGLDAGTTTTYTAGAKTVDGVSFDQIETQFNMNANNPQAQQMMQFIPLLYGGTSMKVYTGAVSDKTSLYLSGLSDANITAAVEAVKTNDDPLARSTAVKAVAAQLPTQRIAAIYIPLGTWASTGLAYAKQFSLDMGVKVPDDLPPIGETVSTDGSALRIDAYVPAQLIQTLTAAGMQMYLTSQKAGQPGGAPGGAGGGL